MHDRDGDWRRPRRVERRRRSASQSSDDEFGRARRGDSAAAGGGGASSDRRRGRRYRDRSRSRDRDRDRRVRRRSRSRTLSPPRVHRDDLARHPRDARPRSRDRGRSRDASRDRRGVARSTPIEHLASGPPHHLQPRRSYGRTADVPRPVRRGVVPSAPAPPGPDDEPAVVDPAADLPGVPIPRWFDASPGTGTGTATGTGTGSTGNAARWGSYAASAEGFGREILDFIAFVQPGRGRTPRAIRRAEAFRDGWRGGNSRRARGALRRHRAASSDAQRRSGRPRSIVARGRRDARVSRPRAIGEGAVRSSVGDGRVLVLVQSHGAFCVVRGRSHGSSRARVRG